VRGGIAAAEHITLLILRLGAAGRRRALVAGRRRRRAAVIVRGIAAGQLRRRTIGSARPIVLCEGGGTHQGQRKCGDGRCTEHCKRLSRVPLADRGIMESFKRRLQA
jgi:hypothetical protein